MQAVASEYELQLNAMRLKLQNLRKQMVDRALQRGRPVRAHPDQYPPLDESKMTWETQIAQLLAMALLEPNTLLPLDLMTLHKRLLQGPAGDKYARALSAMAVSGPEVLIAKMTAASGALESLQLELGPPGTDLADGVPHLWIVGMDRAALARFAGVEDPVARVTAQAAALLAQTGALLPPLVAATPLPGLAMPALTGLPTTHLPPIPLPAASGPPHLLPPLHGMAAGGPGGMAGSGGQAPPGPPSGVRNGQLCDMQIL
ncbi:hypothetical protein V8C86DRAFT_2492679 [Haematococcus lacustris]